MSTYLKHTLCLLFSVFPLFSLASEGEPSSAISSVQLVVPSQISEQNGSVLAKPKTTPEVKVKHLTEKADANLDKVSVQLQWKHQFENAGLYAAIEKGFYADVGLDVELKEIKTGIRPIDDVAQEMSTYGIASSSIIADYLNGKPLVMLANIFKHSALVLVSQPEITQPKELIHKRLMISEEEYRNSSIASMFQTFNVKHNDIEIIPQSYSLKEFIAKEVDAMMVFITNQPYELDKLKVKYNLINPATYGANFYDINIFTSQSQIIKNPERVKAFRRASIRGWHYALENQEEIIDLIKRKYNTQNKTREALRYEARVINNLVLPDVYPIGDISCQILNKIKAVFEKQGIVNKETRSFNKFLFEKNCTSVNTLEFNQTEKNYLNSLTSISMCVDPNWMPFEKINNGKHIGMAADYISLIEQKINKPIRLIETKTWGESLDKAKSRSCDILSLAMNTPERSKYMDFTKPYLVIPLVIATTNDKIFITHLTEVIKEKLGVVKGYAYTELLKLKYPNINLVEVDSVNNGLKLVDKGEIFGFIGSISGIAYHIQSSYANSLKISGRVGDNWELGIAVRNDKPVLLELMDKAIKQITEQEKQQILNKWVSIKIEQGFNYDLFVKILLVLALIVIFILYRYRLIACHNKELEKLSTKDSLTNLYNRRYLDQSIEKSLSEAQRYEIPFGLILLDIDNFKQINDQFGHDVGDIVLKKIAAVLLNFSRSNDTVGRWGGEEFLIVCSHSNFESIIKIAEKLRSLIEKENFLIDQKVTASLGVIDFQTDDSLQSMMRRVDTALYKAKETGKNKVVRLSMQEYSLLSSSKDIK